MSDISGGDGDDPGCPERALRLLRSLGGQHAARSPVVAARHLGTVREHIRRWLPTAHRRRAEAARSLADRARWDALIAATVPAVDPGEPPLTHLTVERFALRDLLRAIRDSRPPYIPVAVLADRVRAGVADGTYPPGPLRLGYLAEHLGVSLSQARLVIADLLTEGTLRRDRGGCLVPGARFCPGPAVMRGAAGTAVGPVVFPPPAGAGMSALPAPGRSDNRVGGVVHGPVVQAGHIGSVHFHAPVAAGPPVPRQVPPPPGTFTDRTADLEALTVFARQTGVAGVRIVVLHGVPGVGASTLAARLLEELREEFPGGQLYADLTGPDGHPAGTGELLGYLLRSLHPGELPSGIRERAAWWRSATARQPVALLLDHAHTADQVRTLLPGGPGHLVVVTSPRLPADLARDGALLHPVTPLAPPDAAALLARIAGLGRTGGDPGAVRAIVGLSAGLPLALGIAGAALAARPDQSVTETAAALSATAHTAPSDRDDRFGAAVNTFLDHAHQSLPAPAARVYRTLGLLFSHDTDTELTAAACDLTPDEARQHLDTLARAGLLHHGGGDPQRGEVFVLHTAARAHARRAAEESGTAGEREEAVRRALDWYLSVLTAAERLLTPTHRHLPRTYAHPPQAPVPFTGTDGAGAWLNGHRDNFLPAVRAAHGLGLHATCWQLVHALWPHLRLVHDYALWIEAHTLGREAARADGHRLAERELLNTLGIGLRGDARHAEAITAFDDVLALAREDGDQRGEAQALHDLGATRLAADDPRAARPPLQEARALRAALAGNAAASGDEAGARTFRRAVALSDTALAQVDLDAGAAREAVGRLTSARAALREIGDRVDAGRALAWLGRAYAAAGDDPAAVQAGERAVDEFTALGVVRWHARSLELLALTHQDAHRPAPARELLEQALTLYTPVSRRDAQRIATRLAAPDPRP
ncbi:tetratricopeptide repeat protein [Streptomyces yaizuensis]|uniref:Tetratricopeptide repeat protein n=1 Tax=Streptomyces yaizuensis TaxID=2989713 RepID=A0ABQ5P6A2_9ACTN|nr:tetratricopeptide repeat protein [Streptomyces sp. YSPA8]GLF98112.1 tetratricopeptide repeat protein [Streptomyces sp. YSPA8]